MIGRIIKKRGPCTQQRKDNIRKALLARIERLGYAVTPETRKKMSEAAPKERPWNRGKPRSEETKRKLSIAFKGEKSSLWRGGVSFELYPSEFNKELKEKVRDRDGRTCRLCGKKEGEHYRKLDVHHIDYNKKNNNSFNLITLCKHCHCRTIFSMEYWTMIFQILQLFSFSNLKSQQIISKYIKNG